MTFLNNLLESSQLPFFTAVILGLLTAISPCPLLTNITAVGFISKKVDKPRTVFLRGLFYAFGRVVSYSVLGFILIAVLRKGGDVFNIQNFVGRAGETVLGPVLIVMGLFMLLGHLLPLPKFGFKGVDESKFNGRLNSGLGSFLLGMLFALAFCPTSGMLYFGMLIPMSMGATGGYFLPIAFGLASSLPILLIAYILAFSINRLGVAVGKMKLFQVWFNRIVALLFIVAGILKTFMEF